MNLTPSATTATVRTVLREQTGALHQALDDEMSRYDLARTADYRCFLGLQMAARRPIEAWIGASAPDDVPAPPPQTALIAQDLAALGGDPDFPTRDFTLPGDSDPVGLYWVLAGSFMGNRAMLGDLRRQGADAGPTRFLESAAMGQYWRTLRPLIERPAEPGAIAGALCAARATFAHFLDTQALTREEIAS